MRKSKVVSRWVVYRMTLTGKVESSNAVCEQSEWEEMERTRPGFHTLVRAGIASESEAELLARGTSGDLKPRGKVGVLVTPMPGEGITEEQVK